MKGLFLTLAVILPQLAAMSASAADCTRAVAGLAHSREPIHLSEKSADKPWQPVR